MTAMTAGFKWGAVINGGNILAGVELIRKTRQRQAFGITFKLITKSDGTKMEKQPGERSGSTLKKPLPTTTTSSGSIPMIRMWPDSCPCSPFCL